MNLKEILVGLENLKVKGNIEKDIKGIENNSKNVKEGFLFIAIKGFSVDGHKYIENAIENGASAIMVEEGYDFMQLNLSESVTLIVAPTETVSM